MMIRKIYISLFCVVGFVLQASVSSVSEAEKASAKEAILHAIASFKVGGHPIDEKDHELADRAVGYFLYNIVYAGLLPYAVLGIILSVDRTFPDNDLGSRYDFAKLDLQKDLEVRQFGDDSA